MQHSAIAARAAQVTVGQLEADPYPVYAWLRREAPACFIPAVGLWFITRYDDVEFAATHPDLFTAETRLGTYQGLTDQVIMSRTPGALRTMLVPRGSSKPEWLAQ